MSTTLSEEWRAFIARVVREKKEYSELQKKMTIERRLAKRELKKSLRRVK